MRAYLLLAALLPACAVCWPRGGAPGECLGDDDSVDDDASSPDDDTVDDDSSPDDDTGDDDTADDDTGDDDTTPADPCADFQADPLIAAWGLVEVCIPPGTFWMGAVAGDEGASPDEYRHQVHLTGAFVILGHEVTGAVLDELGLSSPSDCLYGCGSVLPVQNLTWTAAAELANSLSLHTGRASAYAFSGNDDMPGWDRGADGWRLPTEAEWEYAARAGEEEIFSGSDDMDDVAVCDRLNPYSVVEPASLQANNWGLYDMSGNVSEWVWDAHESYEDGPLTDPVVDPVDPGDFVVGRGGGFPSDPSQCRVSHRASTFASTTYFHRGVRFVRTLAP